MTTRREILKHAPAAALAATAPLPAAAAALDDMPPVPLTGDAKLFELIARYRAEAPNARNWLELWPIEREIRAYEPTSVAGAVALLRMVEEIARTQAALEGRQYLGPTVAEAPALKVLPILEAGLAWRAAT